MGLVFNPFTGTFDFTGTSGGGGGTIGGTIAATQVAFGTGADTIGGSNNLTWDDSAQLFTVLNNLQIGALEDATASVQIHASSTGTGNYRVGYAASSTVENTADNASAAVWSYYFDANINATHNVGNATGGQDFTNRLVVTGGKTDAHHYNAIFDGYYSGAGIITTLDMLSAFPSLDATQLTDGRWMFIDAPDVSNGATIGTWTAIKGADLSSLTVGTAKYFIDYASGKFRVDSAGAITGASTITVGTVSGTTGLLAFKGTTSGTVNLSIADAAGSWTMKLPTTAGTNGYSLTTDGSGNTTWTNVSGGSGATTALDNLASVAINAALVLGTSDAFALGSTSKQWSDLFLAEGGVINWDNGDATITQTGNDITVAGITTFGVGTSTAVTLGTIELGAASDTTIARSAAGTITVEGRGVPQIIASSGTATSTTTSASETNLANILIPGGLMGTNGMIKIMVLYKMTGTNNVKTPFIRHTTASGSTSGGTLAWTNATVSSTLAYKLEVIIWNSNSASAQVVAPTLANSFGQSATTTTAGAINTGNDSYINLNGSCSNNSTDTIGVVGYTVAFYQGV